MNARFSTGMKWCLILQAGILSGCGEDQPAPQAAPLPVAAAPAPVTNVSNSSVVTIQAAPAKLAPAVIATEQLEARLSPGLVEVAKLAQANVGEEVLLAYIRGTGAAYKPTADEIVYLTDLGVSESVITALLNSSKPAVAEPAAPKFAAPEPAPVPVPQAAPVAVPPAPATTTVTEVVTAPAQVVNITYFQSSLAPYGSWIDVPNYGLCWQPSVAVVSRGWRPYSDRGHWIYTDSGWYWQSDYSWGWAAFHYGRWHCDTRRGWLWVPGYTWGPAWVAWRSSDSHCGWAPLPPSARFDYRFGFTYYNSRVGISFDWGLAPSCYTFVPVNRFCDRSPHRYSTPVSHNQTVYSRSTVVNNYIVGNNNTIVNEGIGRDRVASANGGSVRKVALRDADHSRHPSDRRERMESDGNTMVVYRPDARHQTSTASSRQTGTELRPTESSSSTRASFNGSARTETTASSGRNAEPRNPTADSTRAKHQEPGTVSSETTKSSPRSEPARSRQPAPPENQVAARTASRVILPNAPAPAPEVRQAPVRPAPQAVPNRDSANGYQLGGARPPREERPAQQPSVTRAVVPRQPAPAYTPPSPVVSQPVVRESRVAPVPRPEPAPVRAPAPVIAAPAPAPYRSVEPGFGRGDRQYSAPSQPPSRAVLPSAPERLPGAYQLPSRPQLPSAPARSDNGEGRSRRQGNDR